MAQSAIKVRTRRIPLDFLGDAWADAYIDSRFITIPDFREYNAKVDEVGDDPVKNFDVSLEVIKRQFHAGKTAGEDGTLVDLTADDLIDLLDTTSVMRVFSQIMGGPSPKAPSSSNPSTSTADENPGNESSNDTGERSDSPVAS